MNKKHIFTLFTICILAANTVACSSSNDLSTFEDSMSSYASEIQLIHTNIESIDVNSDDATDLALSYLDELNEIFQNIATLEVPEEFISIESLADEAASCMAESVNAYHTLFTTTPYDEYSALLAEENYNRAMTRQYYIGEILQGKVPSGDGITVVDDNDSEDTILENNNADLPTEDLLAE